MGRIKKWNSSLCLLLAAVLAMSWMSGCSSEDSASTKEAVKTEASVEKKSEDADSTVEGEEIPEELLPGAKDQTEGAEGGASDTQKSGTTQSVLDVSEEAAESGNNSGGQAGASGGQSGGNSSPSEPAQDEASEIQVSIVVESQAAGNLVSYADVLTLARGTTAYDALIALCGSQVAASGGYVSGIGGLSEKDYGAKSGWMYSVNGTRPNKSSSNYTLQDGDEVIWSYVT